MFSEYIIPADIPFPGYNKQATNLTKAKKSFPRLKFVHSQVLQQVLNVTWKRGKYYHKVDKDYTSQTCPNCGCHTGKKNLSERLHICPECGYTENRDVAAANVIKMRGLKAVGHTVE